MTKGMFKAGDKVKVVNMGEAFNQYDMFFFDNKEELLNGFELYEIYNLMDLYKLTDDAVNGAECEVLFVGKHRYDTYNADADLLLVMEINSNIVYIISSDGVEMLSAEDMDYNYIANNLDNALDILFDVQRHFISHNATDSSMYEAYKQAVNQIIDVQAEALTEKIDRN